VKSRFGHGHGLGVRTRSSSGVQGRSAFIARIPRYGRGFPVAMRELILHKIDSETGKANQHPHATAFSGKRRSWAVFWIPLRIRVHEAPASRRATAFGWTIPSLLTMRNAPPASWIAREGAAASVPTVAASSEVFSKVTRRK